MFDVSIYVGKNAITDTLLLQTFEIIMQFTKSNSVKVSVFASNTLLFKVIVIHKIKFGHVSNVYLGVYEKENNSFLINTRSNETSSKSSEKSQRPVRSWEVASFCLQVYLNVISMNHFLKGCGCHV